MTFDAAIDELKAEIKAVLVSRTQSSATYMYKHTRTHSVNSTPSTCTCTWLLVGGRSLGNTGRTRVMRKTGILSITILRRSWIIICPGLSIAAWSVRKKKYQIVFSMNVKAVFLLFMAPFFVLWLTVTRVGY